MIQGNFRLFQIWLESHYVSFVCKYFDKGEYFTYASGFG